MNPATELQIFTYEDSVRKKAILTLLILSPTMLLILIPSIAVMSNPKYWHNGLTMILATIVADLHPAHGFKVVFLNLLLPSAVWLNQPYKLKANQEGFLDNGSFVEWSSIQKVSIQNGDFNLKKILVLEIKTENGSRTTALPWPLKPHQEFEAFISNLDESNPLKQLITNRKPEHSTVQG